MSSVLGHATVGASLYGLSVTTGRPRSNVWLTLLVLAALAPDFDYLLLWAVDLKLKPRVSHSLVAGLSLSLLLLGLSRLATLRATAPNTWVLICTPLSHLGLDILVADGGNPLFWPLNADNIVLNIGLLPAAPRLSWPLSQSLQHIVIELSLLVSIVLIGRFWVRNRNRNR